MKRKTGISLMIALLMVFSILTVVTPSVTATSEGYIEVIKEVYDDGSWEDYIEAEYGDTVQFRIIVTYYNCSGNCASNIVVTDTLPAGLEYVETIEPEEPEVEVSDNILIWDFGETGLGSGDSITIKFNALVKGDIGNYGENVNTVNVTAKECIGNKKLSGDNIAIVNIKPSIDVDKKVWDLDTQEWVEHLDSVIKDVDVKFQIAVTYHGDDRMPCLIVGDYLPEGCLEYIKTIYVEVNGEEIPPGHDWYPHIVPDAGDTIEICDIDINISELMEGCSGSLILWAFIDAPYFELHDGDSVVIEFVTNVTSYCECTVTDYAGAFLWGCCPCYYLFDYDYATVDCRPHEPIFEKKVRNGEDWAEETNARVDDIVEFKIELTYYGDYSLSDIRIVDELPKDILEYIKTVYVEVDGEPAITPTPIYDVSEDKKTIWWNLTDKLNDSETLVIEFDALVIGSTGDCEECGKNIATYTATESGTSDEYDGEDTAKVTTTEKIPVELKICIRSFGWGRVRADIKNVGDEDVSNVEWTINVKGSIFKRVNVTAGRTIETLEKGSKKTVSTPWRSILHKFGRITITVTATVGEETFTETAKGFVFGRIVLVRPLIRFGR